MQKWLFATVMLLCALGCRRAVQMPSEGPASTNPKPADHASEWHPRSRGASYQLGLKQNMFTFCDDGGAQQLDIRSGRQSQGSQKCDRKNEVVQSSCDNDVEITGDPAEPYDVVSVEGEGYKLNGHSRNCDREGHLVVISTASDVELIDGAARTMKAVDADVPDEIVTGSGWIAWNSLDSKVPIRLQSVAKASKGAKVLPR